MTVNIFPLLGDSLLIILAGFSLVYSFDRSLGQKTRRILRITSLLLLLDRKSTRLNSSHP